MQPAVLQVYEPSLNRNVQLGKLTTMPNGVWVYRFDMEAKDRMAILDSFGVAPCVVDCLRDRMIGLVHFRVKEQAGVWEITLEDVVKYGILLPFAGRQGAYYNVPKLRWSYRPDYKSAWANEVLTLDWVEHHREPEKPKVEQLSLF